MYNISHDIILYIASYLYNLNYYKNMMLINKEFYTCLHNLFYKKICLQKEFNILSIKYTAIEEKNDDDIFYPSSHNNNWNIYNCINSSCPYKSISVGVVHTYSINKNKDSQYTHYNEYSNNNNISINKIIKNKHSTRRYIPYCKDCMEKYINSVQSNNYIIPVSYFESLLLSL